MATETQHAWALARGQHGVLTRSQLLDLGFSVGAIRHRLTTGRIHTIHRGVYAVGRPELSREGMWLAAVLSCGPRAALSHASAAALWGIAPETAGIEVSAPVSSRPRGGVVLHRRRRLEITTHGGIPVTTPVLTLVDQALRMRPDALERAVNEADRLNLVDPEALRAALERFRGWPGVAALGRVLDRHVFTPTDSELERGFLRLVLRAGLPPPLTRQWVNGYRVDFHWPECGLVVETDGLRYHRTPAQQARDRLRDQAHAAAGLETLRFTHAQVVRDEGHVCATLMAVLRRRA